MNFGFQTFFQFLFFLGDIGGVGGIRSDPSEGPPIRTENQWGGYLTEKSQTVPNSLTSPLSFEILHMGECATVLSKDRKS